MIRLLFEDFSNSLQACGSLLAAVHMELGLVFNLIPIFHSTLELILTSLKSTLDLEMVALRRNK